MATASGGPSPCWEVDRFDGADGVVGSIRFDLPLDGEWSDLTATFDIVEEEGGLVLRLDDVHVM